MHPKVGMISVPLAVAMAGLLTACGPRQAAQDEDGAAPPAGEPGPAAADSVPAELLGTGWRLVEFDAGEPVPEGIEITAEFLPAGIAGRLACNRYTWPVEIDLAAGTLKVGALVSTKMACPPPQMESETRYLGALGRATRFTLEPDRLTLHAEDDAGGTTTLLFERDGGDS